ALALVRTQPAAPGCAIIRHREWKTFLGMMRDGGPSESAWLWIHNARDHAAPWVEWQRLESEPAVESPEFVIERMRQHAKASDLLRKAHGGREGKQHRRASAGRPW
ncbi:MAG: hypothetical protein ACREFS_11000, partial [Acetobacteraceae bacterium]